jgi:hypothetical protein
LASNTLQRGYAIQRQIYESNQLRIGIKIFDRLLVGILWVKRLLNFDRLCKGRWGG